MMKAWDFMRKCVRFMRKVGFYEKSGILVEKWGDVCLKYENS